MRGALLTREGTTSSSFDDKMDWRSWFATKAKLTGKKLQLAVAACEENVIESVAELRALANEDRREYEAAFPFAGVRFAINAALKDGDQDDVIIQPIDNLLKTTNEDKPEAAPNGVEEDKR